MVPAVFKKELSLSTLPLGRGKATVDSYALFNISKRPPHFRVVETGGVVCILSEIDLFGSRCFAVERFVHLNLCFFADNIGSILRRVSSMVVRLTES